MSGMMSSASRLYRVLKVINIDENQVSLSISLVLGEIKGIVSTSAWSKFHNFPCKLKLNEFKIITAISSPAFPVLVSLQQLLTIRRNYDVLGQMQSVMAIEQDSIHTGRAKLAKYSFFQYVMPLDKSAVGRSHIPSNWHCRLKAQVMYLEL